jgi:DMSO reductase family type II enzyme heme b subunit
MRSLVALGGPSVARRARAVTTIVFGMLTALVALSSPALAQRGDAGAGKAVYERKCALCHGEKGDGKGPGADRLVPRPRDLASGIFKIRTTANKTPTDQDLFDVVTHGMPGSSMPDWSDLSEKDRWNVVAYLKTFAAERFKEAPKTLDLPKEVASSADSIKRGREMFEAIECNKCHGAEGRGDGPSRPELKDEWGFPIAPANLTKRWNFRGGKRPRDIATRLAGGVLGTPMPAFLDSVEKPEDIWHLANYVASLGPDQPRYATLLSVTAVKDDLPGDPNADFWKKLPSQDFALAGQVIVEPRNFNPAIDLVSIRAAYNDREIAFHLTWDDPTESRPDPDRKVFADAVSLQLPQEMQAGGDRPYFLLGDGNNAVYLLRWEHGKGGLEMTGHGPDKQDGIPGAEVTASALYKNGQYRVVLKRARVSKDAARPSFVPGVFMPVAFQAWDGGAGETGPKMSLTSWYYLRLEEPQSSRRFLVPPLVAVLTFGVMALIVRAANRRRHL